MIATEQNAQRERRKSVRCDEAGHFRLEEAEGVAIANDKEKLCQGKLHKDDAEDEKDA